MVSYIFMLLFVPALIECYPANIESELKAEVRDEKTYPNGTVVGKYSYVDNEGNPVQVKYFADEKNYGVELESFKVVEGNTEQSLQFSKQPKTEYLATDPSTMVPLEPEALGTDFPSTFPKPDDKYKIPNPNDFFGARNTPNAHCKAEKAVDYDYSRNSLMPLKIKKCGKDKVRLYYDKRSRRVRKNIEAIKEELPIICDQF